MKLPKMPKGLSSRIRKEEAKLQQKKKVNERKKTILAMRKKLETLKNQNKK